jgi:hypothetical protein
MRTYARRWAAVGMILALLGLFAAPGHVLAGGNVGPRAMLAEYYGFINARNYAAAYQQWVNPPQTYAQFVAGYADTTRVDAYFGGLQAGAIGQIGGSVPGVLIGYHTDGSVVAYSGCYDLGYNPATSGMAVWTITGATFNPLGYVPAATQIQPLLLSIYCYPRVSPPGYYDSVQQILVDYFSAVNEGDYLTAYSFWPNPLQTYTDFVAGWSDTTETVMFYGSYWFNGSFNVIETGRVPVVLIGYHTDGSLVAYQGCLGLSFNSQLPRTWNLVASYVQPMPYNAPPPVAAIAAALSAPCY